MNAKERVKWAEENLYWNKYAEIFEVSAASYSQYSGGAIEGSNSEYLKEQYSFVSLAYGRLGTVWTGVTLEQLEDPELDEGVFDSFVADVDSLGDYPVLDDIRCSELEEEARQEAWDSWVLRDFRAEFENAACEFFGCEDTDLPDWVLEYPDENLGKLFELCMEETRETFVEEDGYPVNMWIDVARVARALKSLFTVLF